MLQIVYTSADEDLAKQMERDVAASGMTLEQDMLVVLVSPQAAQDKAVRKSISAAKREGWVLVPVLVQDVDLPADLQEEPLLDIRHKGYDFRTFKRHLLNRDVSGDVRASNRRYLLYFAALVLLIFAISVGALATGIVAPPVDEFATENALQNAQIETLVFPTLNAFQPRTTQDAESFPATVEAASTRIAPFLVLTATALPQNQQATQEAIATAADMTSTARAAATPSADE